VGMAGQKGTPLLQPEDLTARIVFDLVYNPIETPLLKLARQKGLTAISGVEMFVQQGARQFEIWTGKPAPEEEMLRVVLHSLRQSAEAVSDTAAPHAAPTKVEAPEPVAAAPAKTSAKPAEKPVPAKAAVKAPVKAPAKVAAKTVAKPAAKPAVKKPATKAKPKGR
jgi:3-dehydroquinate dehydratase / shikimate dehydrogenase